MSNKRRDNKNRILREGEIQMPDGRYRFKYKDQDGVTRYIYSRRLDKHDSVKLGNKGELSLREKEKELSAEAFREIVPIRRKLTVIELVKKYTETKTGVRESTRAGYRTVMKFLEKDPIGKRQIDAIKTSDAKLWLIRLQKEKGKHYSAIHQIRGVLRPAFRMAVEDDLILKNPFDFELVDVLVNDSVRREAISRAQERTLLDFIKADKHFAQYYDAIYILFNTGLRISEFVGLTISDIDFRKHRIRVNHQLLRASDMTYYIQDTKTNCGTRMIPMTEDVEQCFKRIIKLRGKPKVEPMIDGRVGFIFLDKNGMPTVALHWEHYFKSIIQKYNKIYIKQMPKVTPHVCRHTFCSKMAKSGMNPKTLQYIMGHADIGVTLNTYTHVNYEDAEAEMKRVAAL